METAYIIILLAIFLFIIFLMYISKRNDKVHEFRVDIIDLDHTKRSFNWLDEKTWSMYYDKLPSYHQMVWRFWEPVRLDTYFTQEEIADLLDCDNPNEIEEGDYYAN